MNKNLSKSPIKTLLTGLILGLGLGLAIPVLASSIDLEFNTFRLRDDRGTRFDWGDNIYLDGGTRSIPSAIVFEGEAYINLRVVADILDKAILWNGDSDTYTLTNLRAWRNIGPQIVRADAAGVIWEYSVVTPYRGDFGAYLLIIDRARGYARSYALASEQAIYFGEETVHFVKRVDNPLFEYVLVDLPLENNPDNQDGYERFSLYGTGGFRDPIIVDGILYFIGYSTNDQVTHWHIQAMRLEDFDGWPLTEGIIPPDETVSLPSIDRVLDGFLYFSLYDVYEDDILIRQYRVPIGEGSGPVERL